MHSTKAGDSAGRVVVIVGSTNPVKIEGARQGLAVHFPKVDSRGFAAASRVEEQPFNDRVWEGALNRAVAAREGWLARKEHGKCEDENGTLFFAGIEAGFFDIPPGIIDMQCCILLDERGRKGAGTSPGFLLPPWVKERAGRGETLESMFDSISGQRNIGEAGGAISYLTSGRVDRTHLTRECVSMALVAFLKPELYERIN